MLRIQSIIHAHISYSIKNNFEIENSFLIFINIYIIYIYSVKNSKLLVLKWIQITQNRIYEKKYEKTHDEFFRYNV
jgi:hypothetical protein